MTKRSSREMGSHHRSIRDRLRAIVRWPWRNLPARIVTVVGATALVVSLAVVWVSARSIESFVGEEVDEQFPALLRRATERLDILYSQRQLDVQTFAGSATLVRNLRDLDARASDLATRAEIERYLGYVLDHFPQFRALVLEAPDDRWRIWVGAALELPPSALASSSVAGVAKEIRAGSTLVQVASAPVLDAGGRALATLHAIADLTSIEAELQRDAWSGEAAVYVIGGRGEILMRTPASAPREVYRRTLPAPGAMPAVEIYEQDGSGKLVVGAVRFHRFDWTIAVEQPHSELFASVAAVSQQVWLVDAGIVLFCCLVAAQIARTMVKPIDALARAAKRVRDGEPDVQFPDTRGDEMGMLGRTFNEMLQRLQQNRVELEEKRAEIEQANSQLVDQNSELQRVNEIFHQLSITDDLTKLHNHRFFQDHLPIEMKRAVRTGQPLSLILIDIDDFKRLNDHHGHAVGDIVLRRSADVMRGVVREMDLLARYGGEEFALLASQTDLEGAVALAEKIRLAVARTRFPVVTLEGPTDIGITISIGVARFCGDEKAFFNDADRALYRAKDSGKDCVVAAESEGG